jgi:glycosyltransferase involved in cell wall biosynthesis
VLPYLRELVRGGVAMSLLTFEPDLRGRWSAETIAEWRDRLHRDGIEWYAIPYHKRPSLPATLYDIIAGVLRVRAIARRERIDVIHGRSHVGAAIGALAKRLTGARLIFDIRGFLADEYVDQGNWRAGGLLYRLTKAAERWLYREADGFVVLTERARETIFPDGAGGRPLEVIPCCVDPERFAAAARRDRNALRAELGLAGRTVFVYVGALGGYYLVRETAELLGVAREADPRAYALVLTQSPPSVIVSELERAGLAPADYRVMSVPPDDVPQYLTASDVALSLIRSSYARRSASPTKFAEYLNAGLPVISTAGVGDLDAQIEGWRVGVLLQGLDRAAMVEAIRAMEELRRDPELAARCRAMSLQYDLHSIGGVRYRRLYAEILSR